MSAVEYAVVLKPLILANRIGERRRRRANLVAECGGEVPSRNYGVLHAKIRQVFLVWRKLHPCRLKQHGGQVVQRNRRTLLNRFGIQIVVAPNKERSFVELRGGFQIEIVLIGKPA